MSKEDLLDIVERTAKFNSENAHPMIKAYVEAQAADAAWYDLMGAWDNMNARDEATQNMLNNPEIMQDFASNLFTPKTPEMIASPPEIQSSTEQSFIEAETTPENAQDINFSPAARYSTDTTNLPGNSLKDHSDLLQQLPEHIDNGIYYNLTDLPPLDVPEYGFQTLSLRPFESSPETCAPDLTQAEQINKGLQSLSPPISH